MTEVPQPQPMALVCRQCLTEYADLTLKTCSSCGILLEALRVREPSPQQAQLVDFAGFQTRILERFDRQEKHIREIKSYLHVRELRLNETLEENQRLQTAFRHLRNETERRLQSELYDREGFRKLGLRVLEKFLLLWPTWNPIQDPTGISYETVAAQFRHHRSDTIRRRLNELSKPHTRSCKGYCSKELYGFESPPLTWKQPGHFLINSSFGGTGN